MAFNVKELVWVKIPKYPWWPAEVVDRLDCPVNYSGSKIPVACVKFLNEEFFDLIFHLKNIKSFQCADCAELIEKGSAVKDDRLRLLFQTAVAIAEERTVKTVDPLAMLSSSCHVAEEDSSHQFLFNESDKLACESSEKDTKTNDSRDDLVHKSLPSTAKRKQEDVSSSCKKLKFERTTNSPRTSSSQDSPPHTCHNSEDSGTSSQTSVLSSLSESFQLTPVKISSNLKQNQKRKRKNTKKKKNSVNVCDLTSVTPSRVLPQLSDSNWSLPSPTTVSDTEDSSINRCPFDSNIAKDSCDTDSSDSDIELPEGLSPMSTKPEISENDIVLMKWKRFPFWPACITKVYPKKKKMTVAFILPQSQTEKITVNYLGTKILPYNSKEKERVINAGLYQGDERTRFLDSCEIVEDYLNKKALGRWKGSLLGTQEIIDCDEEDWIHLESDSVSSSSSLSTTDIENEEVSKKALIRFEKRKKRYEKLVSYILSEDMKKYLFSIYNGQRKSDRQKKYLHGTVKEKASLKNAGFGPISIEEQQEEIITVFIEWHKEVTKLQEGELQDVNYILDVWVPEAIVYALIKKSSYARSKAIERFESGIKLTKAEQEEVHNSLIKGAKTASEEEWDRQHHYEGISVPLCLPRKLLKLNHMKSKQNV